MKAFVFATVVGLSMAFGGPVSAQLAATPSNQASLFCDLCAAQGCSCDSANLKCTDCGGGNLTAATGGQEPAAGDRRGTRQACEQAGGNVSRGSCDLN